MRLYRAGPDADDDQQDQEHRQADAPGERLDRTVGLALVGHHVIQTGTQVVHDHDQKQDDDELGRHGGIITPMPATTRRWRRASWFAIALTVGGVVLFVRLGEWQLDRARDAQDLLTAFDTAQHAAFEDFSSVAAAPPPARFPHVRVSGRFVEGRGWLRDEQVRDGKVGVEVIDAFAVDGSAALLLVDRGWVAWTRSADARPALPS